MPDRKSLEGTATCRPIPTSQALLLPCAATIHAYILCVAQPQSLLCYHWFYSLTSMVLCRASEFSAVLHE